MIKASLEQRIIDYLSTSGAHSINTWALANALYDNCMNNPKAGNGTKIANIRRAAEKSGKLNYYVDGNGAGCVFLSNNQ